MKKSLFSPFLFSFFFFLAFAGLSFAASPTDFSGHWTGSGTTKKFTCSKDQVGQPVSADLTITQEGRTVTLNFGYTTYTGKVSGKTFKATKKDGEAGKWGMKTTIIGKINADGTLHLTHSSSSYDIVKGRKKNPCSEQWEYDNLAKQAQ